MTEEQSITITVKPGTLQLAVNALAKQPYETVAGAIAELLNAAQQAQQDEQPALKAVEND